MVERNANARPFEKIGIFIVENHLSKVSSSIRAKKNSKNDDNSQIYHVTPIAPNLKFDYGQFEKAFNEIIVSEANGLDNIKSNYLKEIGPAN